MNKEKVNFIVTVGIFIFMSGIVIRYLIGDKNINNFLLYDFTILQSIIGTIMISGGCIGYLFTDNDVKGRN